MRVLVTGATGRVGSRLLPGLAAAGATVRALVHTEEQAAALWNAGYDVAVGDLHDRDAVEQAVADQDAVLHLAAADGDSTLALARAAVDAGVKRFVYPEGGAAAEEHLQALSGLGPRMVRLAGLYGDGDPHDLLLALRESTVDTRA